MAYTSIFSTLKGEHYKIEISGAGTGELLLSGDNPVTIQYECDDIFKPLKMSGCSVKVLTATPLLDLYTGQLNNITLKVWRGSYDGSTFSGGTMIWFGFLSPNVYSSPYDDVLDEMTLEFVDPLSAMESVKYVRRNAGQWRSFLTYFTEALNIVHGLAYNASTGGAVSTLDYSLSNSKVSETILTQLGVMERNFIDETDDDDNAMSYQEVLEHICRYLNVQAVCYGGTLYFVDTLSAQESKSITNQSIAESGCTLSMGEVYNRITVIESTNPIDEVLYQNILDDDIQQDVMLKSLDSEYYDDGLACYKVTKLYGENYIDLLAFYRPKTDSGWTLVGNYSLILAVADNDTKTLSNTYGIKDGNGNLITYGAAVFYNTNYNAKEVPTKLSFNKSVLMFCDTTPLRAASGTSSQINTINGINDIPLIKYSKTNHSLVMKGGYIVMALKYKYLPVPLTQLEQEHNASDTTAKTFFNKTELDAYGRDFWKIKLKIGNKYWNGTKWTTTESWFQVYHTWDGDENLFYNEKSLDNTNTYLLKLAEDISGYAIPIGDETLFGNIAIEICPPSAFGRGWMEWHNPDYVSQTPGYFTMKFPPTGCVQITEFKLAYSTQQSEGSSVVLETEETDKDIKITGTAGTTNILDLDDIELKVNTWSNIENSYSYVIQKINENMLYYTPATSPEKALINRLLEYYSKPMLNISCKIWNDDIMPWSNCTLQTFSGKNFAVGGITYNLADDKVEVQLNEI